MLLPSPGGPIQFHPPFPPAPDQAETILSIAGIECRFGAGLLDAGLLDFARAERVAANPPITAPTPANELADEVGAPQEGDAEAIQFSAGEGWLGDRMRAFRVRNDGGGRRVEFGAGMVFRISSDGSRIDCLRVPADPWLRCEWLLGPALLLALAARAVYALHASAVLTKAGAVLLAGRSGSGKSTLARVAAASGWVALADDVVPLTDSHGVPRVRPRFPQLKWANPLATADCELPLAALVFVERGGAALSLTPLPANIATQSLVRDTVAARLFAPTELAAHLAFCARLAESGACLRLDLPEASADRIDAEARAALELIASIRRLAAGWRP